MLDTSTQILHPLTGEPIVPLGHRRNGAPIWPIMGAAPGDDEGDTGDEKKNADGDGGEVGEGEGDGGEDEGADAGDGDLGDKGKQALDRMKTQRNQSRAELREYKALGVSPSDIKKILDAKGKSDDGDAPDADTIREEARREARAEAARERVEDKIEAKAAKQFADASDAVAILLRSHDINDFLDDGKVDVEAISEALDELLEAKPHLAAQGGTKRFGGSADGGARKESRPKQLTRDDLSRMKPEDIVKAKAEGRLADLFAGK